MLAVHPSPDGRGGTKGRRVAVTGLGVVAPCGTGRDAFWEGLLGPIPEGHRRVEQLDATPIYGPKEIRRVDRFTQFAAVAAAEAIADAGGLDGTTGLNVDPDRVGVMIGTGIGGLETIQDQFQVLRDKGARGCPRFWCR